MTKSKDRTGDPVLPPRKLDHDAIRERMERGAAQFEALYNAKKWARRKARFERWITFPWWTLEQLVYLLEGLEPCYCDPTYPNYDNFLRLIDDVEKWAEEIPLDPKNPNDRERKFRPRELLGWIESNGYEIPGPLKPLLEEPSHTNRAKAAKDEQRDVTPMRENLREGDSVRDFVIDSIEAYEQDHGFTPKFKELWDWLTDGHGPQQKHKARYIKHLRKFEFRGTESHDRRSLRGRYDRLY